MWRLQSVDSVGEVKLRAGAMGPKWKAGANSHMHNIDAIAADWQAGEVQREAQLQVGYQPPSLRSGPSSFPKVPVDWSATVSVPEAQTSDTKRNGKSR